MRTCAWKKLGMALKDRCARGSHFIKTSATGTVARSQELTPPYLPRALLTLLLCLLVQWRAPLYCQSLYLRVFVQQSAFQKRGVLLREPNPGSSLFEHSRARRRPEPAEEQLNDAPRSAVLELPQRLAHRRFLSGLTAPLPALPRAGPGSRVLADQCFLSPLWPSPAGCRSPFGCLLDACRHHGPIGGKAMLVHDGKRLVPPPPAIGWLAG